jgi:transcription initiation factor TFIIIB Brf1 subunit/transcription initiation factor TFIIB
MTYVGEVSSCKVCGGDVISYEGEWVCRSCGAVPAHVEVETPALATKHATLADMKDVELGSFLGSNDHTALNGYSGLYFEFSTPTYMKTLSDFGLKSPTQKTQAYVLDMVARLGESINLPKKAILDAQHMAASRIKQGHVKKGSLPTLAAYCVIVAARRVGRNTTSWKMVSKNLMLMGHKVKLTNLIGIATSAPLERGRISVEEYLKDAVRNLMMSQIVKDGVAVCRLNAIKYEAKLLSKARAIMRAIGAESFSGYNPVAAATTLLYLAEDFLSLEEKRRRVFTQKMAAELMGVSEYTIREQTAKFKPMYRYEGDQALAAKPASRDY